MWSNWQKRRERIDAWYREIGEIGDPCVYCGVVSSGYDHIPPIVAAERLHDIDLARKALRKYPACGECNTHLGALNLHTLEERRCYLKKRYTRKWAKWLRMPAWDVQELSELGPNLKKHIQGHGKFAEGIKHRISRLGGY